MGCFSADELGMALGRERVIHACLKQGRFARSWMGELSRLSRSSMAYASRFSWDKTAARFEELFGKVLEGRE